MGILWSICCKDGMEPMGPSHSQKTATARMRKQQQQQQPPTPPWGQPPSHKDGGKRSKLLDSGEPQATSYSSINGTGPPAFSPLAEKESKRKTWAKSHSMHSPGSDMGHEPPGSPTSARDKSMGMPMGGIGRSFSLGVSNKKNLDKNASQKGVRRSKRK